MRSWVTTDPNWIFWGQLLVKYLRKTSGKLEMHFSKKSRVRLLRSAKEECGSWWMDGCVWWVGLSYESLVAPRWSRKILIPKRNSFEWSQKALLSKGEKRMDEKQEKDKCRWCWFKVCLGWVVLRYHMKFGGSLRTCESWTVNSKPLTPILICLKNKRTCESF